jgi:hypothetical protein
MNTRFIANILVATASLGLMLAATDASAFTSGRVLRQNAAGGITGDKFRGANGATGGRAGKTTWNADGSATHNSGFRASGAKGNVQSSGSATRSADATVNQSRTTTATSSATGNTMTTNESYSKDTGVTRTSTCTDAGGNTIACPSR